MKTFSIHETKTHLSSLLQNVDRGGVIIFGTRGKAQYQISKLPAKHIDRSKALGSWKGKIKINGDIVSPDKEITNILENSTL